MSLRVSVALSCALLMAACGKSEAPAVKPATGENAGGAAKGVQLHAAQKQFLTIETVGASQNGDILALPGRAAFRPQANSVVGATVAGRVVAQLVRAGEVVKAGAPVLTIESADASTTRIAVDQTATRLAVAESLHRRVTEMVDKGVGLESERQESEAKLKEARAEHERARQAVALIGGGAAVW